MASLPIVEHLDVVEDGVGLFEPRLPLLPVEQFVLHARPEGLHHGIVERVADRPEGRHETGITDSLGEGPGGELSGFNRWKQHWLVGPSVGVHRELLRASSNQGSFAAEY